MRRILALIVLCAALMGGSPVFACASGRAGDCCPPGAPAGCGQTGQLDPAATTCCLTGSSQSSAAAAERVREQQFLKDDYGPVDPGAIVAALVSLPHEVRQSSGCDAAINRAAAPDRSLTYLQTGRLRL
jgi:hypothetical protein